MNKYLIENLNTGTFFVYKMMPKNELDTFGLGMVTNNKIANFLPLSFTSHGDERYFKYNITSKVTLKQFLSSEVNCIQCVALLKGLAAVFNACDEYMLSVSSILTDPEHIFVDVSSCEPNVVYLPIIDKTPPLNVMEYLKEILTDMRFSDNGNLEYPGKIINILNSTDKFSYSSFCNDLNEVSTYSSSQQGTEEYDSSNSIDEEQSIFVRILNLIKGKRSSNLPHISIPSPESGLLDEGKRITGPISGGSLDFGETCYLGAEQEDGATTLLKGYEGIPKLKRAYLIRERTQEEVEINREVFRMGTERNYVNYTIEDNTAISRSHADIIQRAREYYIVDNNSSNHTYVEGQQLTSGDEVPIEDGTEIVLADELFRFVLR